MRKLAMTLLFVLSFTTIAAAQQSKIFTDDLTTYNQALDLYQEDQYLASQRLFEKVMEVSKDEVVKGNAAYYIANCAVRLNQRNADYLVERFV